MASKALLSFLLIISSVHLCLSQSNSGGVNLEQLLPGLGQAAVVQDAKCMQKLLPCQPFLKSPNNPPPSCCVPLNEMATNEVDCLCSVMNNPQLLLSINVSKEDAMKLPGACDIEVDISKCNSTGASSSTQDSSSSSQDDTTVPDEETSEDSTSSTNMISPYGIMSLGVPGFVALSTALVFSSY
ncbi:non-specific lipid transfer protein GPI-anchored 3-like isoform X2 [Lotus japonicus]|uniref:non-specific lipid transfer protein GPI-anchored 3-like isoform X2 n=1 Tax=Lotus japonicus TaxID=34305 RepID=UPI0025846840|nr:non-specific lipid transfer protein GPI-anchored 3-like isoform X2 [Lotus japonicus]